MRILTRESGATLASIYRNLGDRDAVLSAVLDRAAEDLDRPELPADPLERLRALAWTMYDFLSGTPWVVDILRQGGQMGLSARWIPIEFLRTTDRLGLSAEAGVAAYRTVWNFVLGALLTRAEPGHFLPADSAMARKLGADPAPEDREFIDRFLNFPVGTSESLFRVGLDALLEAVIPAMSVAAGRGALPEMRTPEPADSSEPPAIPGPADTTIDIPSAGTLRGTDGANS